MNLGIFARKYGNKLLFSHIFRTYICPVLRSGISTFVLSQQQIQSLNLFHRKTLKWIIQVSKRCNTAGIHFILSEAPIEAKIHRDMFNIFYNIWSNPQCTLFKIVEYIQSNMNENSKTWCNYFSKICIQYGVTKPSILLQQRPPKWSEYKRYIEIHIIAFHEKQLREKANNTRRLQYFNVN